MSARRLVALIRALPADSALARQYGQEESHDAEEKTVIRSGDAFANWMNTHAKDA